MRLIIKAILVVLMKIQGIANERSQLSLLIDSLLTKCLWSHNLQSKTTLGSVVHDANGLSGGCIVDKISPFID